MGKASPIMWPVGRPSNNLVGLCCTAEKVNVGVRGAAEGDILEQWRRRRRLELIRQRAANTDVLFAASQRLVQPHVCITSLPLCCLHLCSKI